MIVQEFTYMGAGVYEGREYDPLSPECLDYAVRTFGISMEDARAMGERIIKRLSEAPDGIIQTKCGILKIRREGDPSVAELAGALGRRHALN
jgi:hypothetical protein